MSRSATMSKPRAPGASAQPMGKPDSTCPASLRERIEAAFQFRGDVTIQLTSGREVVGYLFNRDMQATVAYVEVFPKDAPESLQIALEEIVAVELTGVDPAAGKSWEAWLKKVAEAEADGRIAELYPESLDETESQSDGPNHL